MGDQNKFEEYWQKLLQYWGAFLAFCGRLWNSVKVNAKKGWDFLSCHGKELGQKAAALLVKAVAFSKAQWNRFTAWLRKLWADMNKEESLLTRAKLWCGGVIARLQPAKQPAALPQAEEAVETVEAPAVEHISETVDAPAVETAVAAPVEEIAPAAAEVLPMEEPAAELPAAAAEEPAVEESVVPASEEETAKTDISVMEKIRNVFRSIGKWIRRLYKIVMAAPVVYAAVKLALDNMERLPELVGLDIQANGEFGYVVARELAVLGPLAITVFCLVLMFFAKKPLLPWVISIFTLVLPVLLWVTNLYA